MGIYLEGLEPDFDVRQELHFIGGVLDLRQFDKIFISVSGGKDSHAMLFLIKALAEKQEATDRLLCMYADTGMEWYNAETHVKKICRAAGVPLEIVYPVRPMIELFKFRMERVSQNGKSFTKVAFPSAACRYCTAMQKCDPMDKLIRKYSGKLLKITGERWQESYSRSFLSEFVKLDRLSTKKNSVYRQVYGWRPMLVFQTQDVFQMIKDSGVERHPCYDLGTSRLGCAGCIFSSDRDLKIEMENNPLIFEQLDKLEVDSGFTISPTGKLIRDRIKS